MIHKTYKKMPYELWNGRKPKVNYFHTFGVKCFIHNNGKTHLKAFDEKVDEGIFVGYSSTSKAFKVLNKETMVVEEPIHVVFDEVNFNIEEAEKLAEKVDHLKINEEVCREVDKVDDESKKVIRKAALPKSIDDDVEDEVVVALESETTPQPESEDDEDHIPAQPLLQDDLRWLRDHPPESVIGDI